MVLGSVAIALELMVVLRAIFSENRRTFFRIMRQWTNR
jgi:hypothetical protein